MTRFIRFVWGLASPEILVVYALPETWWLQWFERYPEMIQPDLEQASALMSLRHEVDPDTLRRLVLEDNPAFPDPTAEENLTIASGRGLTLMKAFMTEVIVVPPGNRIEMTYAPQD